jgi:hypothetical protein
VAAKQTCLEGHDLLPNGLHVSGSEEKECPAVHGTLTELKAVDPIEAQAEAFIRRCGLTPTQDAIEQLAFAFLPALQVMCDPERDYPQDGSLWKGTGWRGLLIDIRKKFGRLWYRGWKQGRFFADDPLDLMTFLGMYYRLANSGEPWGEYGEPGNE